MPILHYRYIMCCGGGRGEWERMKSISACPLEAYPLLLGISYAKKRLSNKQESMEQGQGKRETGDKQIALHVN